MKYKAKVPNRAQREGIAKLYQRSPDGARSYLAFRRRFRDCAVFDAFVGEWCGMIVGVELDGCVNS